MKLGLGLGINFQNRLYSYQPETKTLLSALSGTYSTARKKEMDKLIKSLKTAGIWSKLDVLQMYAAPTAADAVVNWKNPGTFNATLVNSPTLEVDRGITGNGTSSYISTGYNPISANGNYQQNSACLGVYIRSVGTVSRVLIGHFENPKITAIYSATAGDMYTAINNSGGATPTYASKTTLGLVCLSRVASANYKTYIQGTDLGTKTQTSDTPANLNITVLAMRNSTSTLSAYSNAQVALSLVASGLNQTEVTALTNALETYLDYIGAGVIS